MKDITVGVQVWSVNSEGDKILSNVLRVSHTPTPPRHHVVHLVLSDDREVWVSPNHPTVTGLRIADLKPGDYYDGSRVKIAENVLYWDTNTYDLLPDSDTGFYYANGILLGSTLK